MQTQKSIAQLNGSRASLQIRPFQAVLYPDSLSRSNGYLVPFLFLLAVYCGWVLSLPLFPTQDDSMHLYYVDVLHRLLAGHSTFSNFYSFRNPPPPYTVQYLLLLGLTSLLDPTLAEKVMVCIILASTAFGFRYLATGIGPAGRLMSLWIFPVALSWPLFMGFHNFCLSVSFILWSLGLWVRASKVPGKFYRVAFLLSVTVVALTHPVPLLFLLGVVGADVAARVIGAKYGSGYSWRRSFLRQRLNLAWAGSAFLSLTYISLFLNKHPTAKLPEPSHRLADFLTLVRMEHISFATGGPWTKLHRLGLLLILALGIALAVQTLRLRWQSRKVNTGSVFLLCTAALVVVLPLMPSRMNGLDYFADRLPIFVWLFALAAASAAVPRSLTQGFTGPAAIVFALFTLLFADRLLRPVAAEISIVNKTVEHSQPQNTPALGLIFDAPVKIQSASLSFNPFFRWAGVRYVERAGALLLDDPWAGAPNILPVDRVPNNVASFSQYEFQYPEFIYKQLLDSPEKRDAIFSKVSFVIFVGRPLAGTVEPLLAVDSARQWACNQSTWYFVCTSTPQRTSGPHILLQPPTLLPVGKNKVLLVRDRYARSTSEATPFTYSRQY